MRRRTNQPEVVRDGPIGMNETERQLFATSWLWHVPLKPMDAMEVRRYSPGVLRDAQPPVVRRATGKPSTSKRATARFDAPAYHVTGWYDTLLTGTLRNFTGLRKHARYERARSVQRLLVGPWTHSRPTLTSSTKIGDVDFGPNAGFALESRWWLVRLLAEGRADRRCCRGRRCGCS